MSEQDIPLNTPEGQRLLGARDVIVDGAIVPFCGVDLNPSNGAFAFHHVSGDPIVTIRYDGRVEVNPAFTVDEAARAFWDAVIRLNPYSPEPKP